MCPVEMAEFGEYEWRCIGQHCDNAVQDLESTRSNGGIFGKGPRRETPYHNFVDAPRVISKPLDLMRCGLASENLYYKMRIVCPDHCISLGANKRSPFHQRYLKPVSQGGEISASWACPPIPLSITSQVRARKMICRPTQAGKLTRFGLDLQYNQIQLQESLGFLSNDACCLRRGA